MDEVRYIAVPHPSVSVQSIAELMVTIETWRAGWDMPPLFAEAWRAVAARQTGHGARLKALEWAAIAELEEQRRRMP